MRYVHDFCRQYFLDVFILVEVEFLNSTFMIFSTNALSRRFYFNESISMKSCWEFVSTLVCVTSIMKTRKLVYFFWITSSSTLLSYTSSWTNWFRNMIITRVNNARASLIFLSMLNAVFMNKTKLISKFDFQCSCLKMNMTKQQQQI